MLLYGDQTHFVWMKKPTAKKLNLTFTHFHSALTDTVPKIKHLTNLTNSYSLKSFIFERIFYLFHFRSYLSVIPTECLQSKCRRQRWSLDSTRRTPLQRSQHKFKSKRSDWPAHTCFLLVRHFSNPLMIKITQVYFRI